MIKICVGSVAHPELLLSRSLFSLSLSHVRCVVVFTFSANHFPSKTNTADIFSWENAFANMNHFDPFVQSDCNRIMLWTWKLWSISFPGGVNRKDRVQRHSTLPMPSSAESRTQQAVWRVRGWHPAHLSAAVALTATSLMNDLQEALCAIDTICSSGLFRKGSY